MKYIVLSFDDGFSDFKNNALPILDEFGVKVSIAIVSGYVDGTITPSYECMTKDDIKKLILAGHEIAMHSDSHSRSITIKDYVTCKEKFTSWFGENNYGAIIPYSQKIGKDLLNYFNDIKILYFADYRNHIKKWTFRENICRIINHIIKSRKRTFMIDNHRFVYSLRDLNTMVPYFQRMPIKNGYPVDWYIDFIKKMKDGCCLTLMFHSVTKGDDNVEWPEGAIDYMSFKKLICFLKTYKKCELYTQSELVKYAKN